jgi:hypothetical protein
MKLKKQDIAKLKKHNRVRTKTDRDNNGKEKNRSGNTQQNKKKKSRNRTGRVVWRETTTLDERTEENEKTKKRKKKQNPRTGAKIRGERKKFQPPPFFPI